MRKSILVAGGAGFLGSHVCDRLVADGHEVICLDNFFTGRMQNVEHLVVHPRFKIVFHDVTEAFEAKVDEIYNLACPASPAHYQLDPVQTIKTNLYGAINLLDLAARAQCRIFQASTSEVYGDPLVHPQPESYWGNVNPNGARSCYDEGKRCAETLFFDYYRQYGIDIRVARIFNTFGPRMRVDDGRVVSNFIVQALRGDPITIYGNGNQTRSFCYVEDMVDGFIELMDQHETVGPINLGNPVEVTVRQLAEVIIEITNSASRLVFQPLPQDDPVRRKPDISLAERYLAWRPSVQLREGLERTAANFERQLSAPKPKANSFDQVGPAQIPRRAQTTETLI